MIYRLSSSKPTEPKQQQKNHDPRMPVVHPGTLATLPICRAIEFRCIEKLPDFRLSCE